MSEEGADDRRRLDDALSEFELDAVADAVRGAASECFSLLPTCEDDYSHIGYTKDKEAFLDQD